MADGRLDCAILTSDSEIDAIRDEWRALHARAGRSLFTDYDWFAIWWQTLGNTGKRRLHIITGRKEGKLVALLPLAVVSWKGFRILQATGAEAFFCCDALCEDPAYAAELWQAARKSPHYDFAHIRDACPDSPAEQALATFAQVRDRDKSYYLSVEWPTAEAWMAKRPIPRHKKIKEHLRQLQKKGEVRFDICQTSPVPTHIVDGLVEHKAAWCRKYGRDGMFDQPNIGEFYRRICEHTARNGTLALAWLACGGEIIAWHLMFLHKDKVCSYIPATNERWLAYSPGHLLNIRGVSWAIDNGFKEFDHMQGDFAYKQMFANNEREYREYTFQRSVKGWLGVNLFIGRRSLRKLLSRKH